LLHLGFQITGPVARQHLGSAASQGTCLGIDQLILLLDAEGERISTR
jgi:hypothetical protein